MLAEDSGWGRPLQAADCAQGREGEREGRGPGGGSFYSKQTNKLFCFKKPKRKKEKERKKENMSLLATGRAAGTIWGSRGEKARSQARRGQGLPSGAPPTAGHWALGCTGPKATLCVTHPDSSREPRMLPRFPRGWLEPQPAIKATGGEWEARVQPPPPPRHEAVCLVSSSEPCAEPPLPLIPFPVTSVTTILPLVFRAEN